MFSPCAGWVSSEYDLRRRHPVSGHILPHRGIDIANHIGTPIYAAFAGVVESVYTKSWRGDKRYHFPLRSGNHVFVRNPDGEAQYYGHFSKVLVRKGQQVAKGQLLGYMGDSGNVTGPHLHFETHGPSSGYPNLFRGTFNPRKLFSKYKVVPGSKPDHTKITTASKNPPKHAKGILTVSEANRIIKELKTRASAAQVKAVYARQSAYKREQDTKHAALEKRIAALEKQVGTRASAAQVKAVYERQSRYQRALLTAIAKVADTIKDKLNIQITLKDR